MDKASQRHRSHSPCVGDGSDGVHAAHEGPPVSNLLEATLEDPTKQYGRDIRNAGMETIPFL